MAPPPRDEKSVNDVIQDTGIRHATFLERLKTRNVNGTVGFLNREVFPDLVRKLERRLNRIRSRGFDTGPFTTKRYKDMVARMGMDVTDGMNGARKILRKELRELSIMEADWQAARLRDAAGPFGVDFVTPPKPLLRALVDKQPINGLNLRGWFSDLGKTTKDNLARQIGIGMAQGEATPEIIRRIRGTSALGFSDGVFQTSRIKAETLVRTTTTHVAAQARELTYKENKDVVKAVQWISTLDDRTCEACASLDSQTFEVGTGERPPIHPRCRCTTVPVLRSWEELGLDLKELPESTRASMNGQVSSKITYPKWLKGQTAKVQNQVLGPGKAKLFRSGKVTIDKFVDDKNRPLSLANVRKLEGLPE